MTDLNYDQMKSLLSIYNATSYINEFVKKAIELYDINESDARLIWHSFDIMSDLSQIEL